MILDVSAWLKDGRLADLEVQKAAQEFIFTRGDLYTSDMLILQYSVDKANPKGELTYKNVKEAVLVVLMVESPRLFQDFDATSDRYIHRFTRMVADTGLSYEMKAKVVYVQCDKCLAQLRDGANAESADGVPDRL